MKKIYTLVGVALLAGTSFAQSINRPYEFKATEKHAPNAITTVDGREFLDQDRATYYSEDFDGMTVLDGSEGWTAALQNGNVEFGLTNSGPANTAGSSFVIPALTSSTPTQWILLDSDSDGASGADEDATFTSNTIDLTANGSGVTGTTPLKLEFEQFFAEWESGNNYDTLYVGISDDAGVTWEEVQISNGVGREGRPNPEVVSLNITDWVTDPTNVQIRFRWDGNWAYGWQFDNVSIADLPPNDIAATAVFRGDYANAYVYSMVPQDQATEFIIGVATRNIGFNDQTNIGFDWTITDPASGTTTGSSSTTNIALLSNGEQDTIWVSTGVTPTILGNYTIDFEVTSDQTDDEPSNNTMSDSHFELTSDIYAADYGTVKTAFYNWADNNNGEASIGTNYSIITDGVIGAIDAELDDDINVVDQLIKYTLYKYDFNSQEYTYIDETDEYTTVAADQGSFVRLLFDNAITVTAGDLYLACAGHLGGDPSAGFVMAGQVPEGQVAGYNETAASADLISSLASPSAAAVRLVMIDYTGVEETTINEGVSIYPNPANSQINVELTYTNSENTVVNVMDITGKTVKTMTLGTVNGTETVSVSLEGLTNGVYFVEVVSSTAKEVKKFVKK